MSNYSDLFEQLWALHPLGNHSEAKRKFLFAVHNQLATAEQIITKYRQYLELCRSERREERFIKKIEGFLRDEDYNGEYESPEINRQVSQYEHNEPTSSPIVGKARPFGQYREQLLAKRSGKSPGESDGGDQGQGDADGAPHPAREDEGPDQPG